MNGREQMLERERRWGPLVGISVALIVGLFFATAIVLQGVDIPDSSRLSETLPASDEYRSELIAAAALQGIALALLTIPLSYLFRAAAGRDERVRSGLIGIVVAGPLFIGAGIFLQRLALSDVAADFVQQMPVTHPEALAEDLQADSVLGQLSAGLTLAGVFGFVFGAIYTSQRALRAGLLTRFWGTLGMAGGGAFGLAILAPPLVIPAAIILAVWLVQLSLIALDRWPRGPRPPAWDAGEAIPWPSPGENVAGGDEDG